MQGGAQGPSTKAQLAEILEMERQMDATKMPLSG